MKIYVGNLSYDVTEEELRAEFEKFGVVESVAIPADKFSGRSKGFAFIEMPTVAEGQAAITGLSGKVLKERTLAVDAAKPRTDDRRGGSFQGGGRGGSGGGGGRGGGYGGGGFGGGRRGRY
ncbi:MAG: RNA-binding protein [Dehalococcoidia bacterium]|nr:RNA-binding protein [Dehalococcoidia bacterium]MDZ4245720.1 RNA-binding protein [Dehalococcoidia bacterium]